MMREFSNDEPVRVSVVEPEPQPEPDPEPIEVHLDPRVYREDKGVTVWHGECVETMRLLLDESVDAVVTDPPYGLEFMGKEWDSFGGSRNQGSRGGTSDKGVLPGYGRGGSTEDRVAFRKKSSLSFQEFSEVWACECLRVLKPGGHLLAFGGSRTYHRLTCAIEDAGFEIRDSIAWLYGSGFPKSHDVGKTLAKLGQDGNQWNGWGTALKPAMEPIVVARKPFRGTVAANVLAHGVGALNIDANRIGTAEDIPSVHATRASDYPQSYTGEGPGWGRSRGGHAGDEVHWDPKGGRWPANLVLSHSDGCRRVGAKSEVYGGGAGTMKSDTSIFGLGGYEKGSGFVGREVESAMYECEDGCPVKEMDGQGGTLTSGTGNKRRKEHDSVALRHLNTLDREEVSYGDTGGASRYFTNLDSEPSFLYQAKATKRERPTVDGVSHPTVKPVALMRWLVRLVTPVGGVVLDPFVGSGSTAEACVAEGMRCVGVERDESYLPLIDVRLNRA